MPSKNCIVKGCNNRKVPMHRFPIKSPEDFKIWVVRTGNETLLNMNHAQIYNSFVICEQHFELSCKSPGTKRLKCKSLPTLNLPSIKPIKYKLFCVARTCLMFSVLCALVFKTLK